MNFELLYPIKIKLNENEYKYLFEFYYYGRNKADEYYESSNIFKKFIMKLASYTRILDIPSNNSNYKKILHVVNKYVSEKVNIEFTDRELSGEFVTMNKKLNYPIAISKNAHQMIVFSSKVKAEVNILLLEESMVVDKEEYEIDVNEAIFLKPHNSLKVIDMNETESLEILIITINKIDEELDEIYIKQE